MVDASRKSTSRAIADWATGLRPDDVPAEVAAHNPLRVIDSVGLMIGAARMQAVGAALAVFAPRSAMPAATAIGSPSRVGTDVAALVNAVAAHGHDFDDTFLDSMVHPGSIVVPTALAVAEAAGSRVDEFSLAITLGYEFAARLGTVAGRGFHQRHLHPSGVIGPMVAALVAGRLLQLSPQHLSWAIGLAASMAGGIRAYAVDGGWSKWLHLGWAAHGGVTAAELAAGGFRGPQHALDGDRDLFAALLSGQAVDREPLLRDLGTRWHGAESVFKYYDCAHVIHPFLEAARAILGTTGAAAADIVRVHCRVSAFTAAVACDPHRTLEPENPVRSRGSLFYQLSRAILDAPSNPSTRTSTAEDSEELARLASVIEYEVDPAVRHDFDGTLEITLRSGERVQQRAQLPVPDDDRVCDKFLEIAAPVVGLAAAGRALSWLRESPADWRAATRAIRMTAEPEQ